MAEPRRFVVSLRVLLVAFVFVGMATALAVQATWIVAQDREIAQLTERLLGISDERDQLVTTIHQMTTLQLRIMTDPRRGSATSAGPAPPAGAPSPPSPPARPDAGATGP